MPVARHKAARQEGDVAMPNADTLCVRVRKDGGYLACMNHPVGYYFDLSPSQGSYPPGIRFLLPFHGSLNPKYPATGPCLREITAIIPSTAQAILSSPDPVLSRLFRLTFALAPQHQQAMIQGAPVTIVQLGAAYAVPPSAAAFLRGYRRYLDSKALGRLRPTSSSPLAHGPVAPGHISFGGDYSGMPSTYDPFDPKTPRESGLIRFDAPACSVRSTRAFAYDRVTNSRFAVTRLALPCQPGSKAAHEYVGRGLVDFRKGSRYALPLVDPSASFLSLFKPATAKVSLFRDSAGNLYLEPDRDHRDEIEYVVGTDRPLEELAFMDPTRLTLPLPRQANGFGAGHGIGHQATYGGLCKALQDYFQTYDATCSLDFHDLESQTSQAQKIAAMLANHRGACRHRAFLAFLVMESTGTRTRYVTSRTHAWIEFEAAGTWRYLDLGGCPVPHDPEPDGSGQKEPPCPAYDGPPLPGCDNAGPAPQAPWATSGGRGIFD